MNNWTVNWPKNEITIIYHFYDKSVYWNINIQHYWFRYILQPFFQEECLWLCITMSKFVFWWWVHVKAHHLYQHRKMENTQSLNYKHIRICIHRFRAFDPWQNTVEWYINWKQVLCIKDKFQFWTHIKFAYAQHPLMCESHNYGTFVLNAHVFIQGKWLNINDKL